EREVDEAGAGDLDVLGDAAEVEALDDLRGDVARGAADLLAEGEGGVRLVVGAVGAAEGRVHGGVLGAEGGGDGRPEGGLQGEEGVGHAGERSRGGGACQSESGGRGGARGSGGVGQCPEAGSTGGSAPRPSTGTCGNQRQARNAEAAMPATIQKIQP